MSLSPKDTPDPIPDATPVPTHDSTPESSPDSVPDATPDATPGATPDPNALPPARQRKPRQPPQPVPEYAECDGCGEYAHATLRMVRGHCRCLNCRDRRHAHLHCAICARTAPGERHHVASERQHRTFTIPVCLNCHHLLSLRQQRWDRAWLTDPHLVRCLVQGVWDVVALWFERSPAVEQCRSLVMMLAHAAWLLLPYLRLDALGDLGGVRFRLGGAL